MVSRTIIATISVAFLLLFAGCAGLNPLDDPSTAEKIETEMSSVETVQVNTTTTQVFSLTNNETVVNDSQRQQIRTRYNFTRDAFVSQGFGQRSVFGQQEQFAFERYYVDGTIHTRRATSVNNTTTRWQSQQTDIDLQKRAASVADADFLSHYEATKNNSTLVYEIDMLSGEEHVERKLENRSFTPFDTRTDILDTYMMEVYVDSETHRLEEVRIFVQADLSSDELAQMDDVYAQPNQSATQGRFTYATALQFDGYNEPVNITLPEEVNESEP